MKRRLFTNPQRGFTLVELVVAITLTTIVVSFAAVFVSGPVQGYANQTRRVALVDESDVALRRISRDVRRALPNSVRVRTNGARTALEMLTTVDGARYRDDAPGAADDVLDLTAADTAFNTVGPFSRIAKPFVSNQAYLSIYNVAAPGANAYELANVITPPGTSIDIRASATAGEDRVTLNPPFRFRFASPAQRVFLVDGPVTYLCDPVAGSLTRFDGYAIATDQADVDTAGELTGAGAAGSRVASRLTACDIDYAPGTAARAGLVTLSLTVGEAGESVTLLHQVHVNNVP